MHCRNSMWTCLRRAMLNYGWGLTIIIVHTKRRCFRCFSVWILQFARNAARNTMDVPQFELFNLQRMKLRAETEHDIIFIQLIFAKFINVCFTWSWTNFPTSLYLFSFILWGNRMCRFEWFPEVCPVKGNSEFHTETHSLVQQKPVDEAKLV